jgi:hypothetical protein
MHSRTWAILASVLLGLGAAAPARAAQGLTVTADQALRFGSFVVVGTGTRTVSAAGTVTDSNTYPVSGAATGPAQFTLVYERAIQLGIPVNLPILVTVQIIIAPVAPVTQNGVTGTISRFTTDLPGNPTVTAGQAFSYTLPLCVTLICQQTFRVGGSIDASQSTAGTTITAPLSVTATIQTVL